MFVNFDKIADGSYVLLFYKNPRRGPTARALFSNGLFHIVNRQAGRVDGTKTLEEIKLRCSGYAYITGISPFLCQVCNGIHPKCDDCGGAGIIVDYFIKGERDARRIYTSVS